jgi:hypothetical protein
MLRSSSPPLGAASPHAQPLPPMHACPNLVQPGSSLGCWWGPLLWLKTVFRRRAPVLVDNATIVVSEHVYV